MVDIKEKDGNGKWEWEMGMGKMGMVDIKEKDTLSKRRRLNKTASFLFCFQCQTILEEHEDRIIQFYKHRDPAESDNMEVKFCVEHASM